MNNVLLKLSAANKSFGNNHILKDIDLEIHEGKVNVLIGPSGAGKSTLLRALSLLESFESGELSYKDIKVCTNVDGKAIYDEQAVQKSKEIFGLVFQQFNLFPHLSALENITNPLCVVKKMDKDVAKQKALCVLDKLQLLSKKDFYPWQLSGGQRQRLAIARALAMEPEILYFDEPTSALDKQLVTDLSKTIKDLAQDNLTMLIVTHDLDFAREVADQVYYMEAGRIIEEGTSSEIFERPKQSLTQAFIS